jgi:glycosyltransferase involved in cell wall biosynthesis
MKLIVQIPCYNEEKHIAAALEDVPRALPGVDVVETQVIDDGSSDGTARAARESGAHHVVLLPQHMGLAHAFLAGVHNALSLGADVLVNTDADRPYSGRDIERLVAPIVRGEAQVVVGCRDIRKVPHFSPLKRLLQHAGAWVVNRATGLRLPDVTSGFRAYGREAMLRMNVFSHYSYTLETLIQAGRLGLAVAHIMVEPNPEVRPSRLARSIAHYVLQSCLIILRVTTLLIILRVTTLYYPLRVFLGLGALSFVAALALVGRYLYYYTLTGAVGHLPSLALAGVLVVLGIVLSVGGLLADLMAAQRMLLEETLYRERQRLYAHRAGSADAPPDSRAS